MVRSSRMARPGLAGACKILSLFTQTGSGKVPARVVGRDQDSVIADGVLMEIREKKKCRGWDWLVFGIQDGRVGGARKRAPSS